jgi:hypothetical protein
MITKEQLDQILTENLYSLWLFEYSITESAPIVPNSKHSETKSLVYEFNDLKEPCTLILLTDPDVKEFWTFRLYYFNLNIELHGTLTKFNVHYCNGRRIQYG